MAKENKKSQNNLQKSDYKENLLINIKNSLDNEINELEKERKEPLLENEAKNKNELTDRSSKQALLDKQNKIPNFIGNKLQQEKELKVGDEKKLSNENIFKELPNNGKKTLKDTIEHAIKRSEIIEVIAPQKEKLIQEVVYETDKNSEPVRSKFA